MADAAQQLWDVVEPYVSAEGVELDDVEVLGGGKIVRVVVDSDQSLGVDRIADLSRGISRLIDEDDPFSGSYTLEVTSIVGGFVSMSAEATSGGLSASAFLPAQAGSRQVDFSLVGGLSFDIVADVSAQELETQCVVAQELVAEPQDEDRRVAIGRSSAHGSSSLARRNLKPVIIELSRPLRYWRASSSTM